MAQSTCTIDGCEMQAISRGWCRRHYNAQYKGAKLAESSALVPCPHCGKDFEVGRNRKYCSDSCRNAFKWRQRDKAPCSICGLPTGQLLANTATATHNRCRSATWEHGTSKAYKIIKCRCDICKKYQADVMRDYFRRLAKGETNAAPCTVEDCSNLSAARGLCKMHYRRWARANGLVNSPSEKWGDARRSNWHARRARMNGAQDGDRVLLAALLERDGSNCSACGEHIDVDAPWPQSHSPSIDHTIPVSKGGAHSMANTTVMHLGCNIRKGAKTPAIEGQGHEQAGSR